MKDNHIFQVTSNEPMVMVVQQFHNDPVQKIVLEKRGKGAELAKLSELVPEILPQPGI